MAEKIKWRVFVGVYKWNGPKSEDLWQSLHSRVNLLSQVSLKSISRIFIMKKMKLRAFKFLKVTKDTSSPL